MDKPEAYPTEEAENGGSQRVPGSRGAGCRSGERASRSATGGERRHGGARQAAGRPQLGAGILRRQLEEVLEGRNPFRFSNPPDKSKVARFENEFAARMQTRYGLAVTSGTAALHVAMAALEVGPGDEVILPAWTWYSCYNTVIQAGGLPVFAEIDESFNIDPTAIEPLITPQTKVIMAVHLQGNPADMDPILALARKHRLKVLEDASQSVGASYKGKPLGSMGDIGIYSLQQSKTITAGEGGALVTGDP